MRPILVLVICVVGTRAQDIRSVSGTPCVRVHGQSTVSMQPDEAEMDIGVITQATTANAASAQNTAQASAVIQQLRMLLPSATIETVNFSVNPHFRFPKDGGTPETLGYSADTTLRIVVEDISVLQKAIALALKSGGSNINRLDFMLRDEKPARARALADAASQAQSGADALAASLKLKLGRLLLVEEGQPVIVSPAREVDLEKIRATDMTPISPGSIQVRADVNLTYEIAGYTQ